MSSDSYSRPSGALHNKYDTDDKAFLAKQESASSLERMIQIKIGEGPKGNFDNAHLKAIHGHIFKEAYAWSGHTRNETFTIDGNRYEPVNISKGETSFLPQSRIEFGLNTAFKPIQDRQALTTIAGFSERAGAVLGELNYVHPFREGNGRTQRSFIAELGREHGHKVDFSVITSARMLDASIATTNNPNASDMKDLVLDATDPSRRRALGNAINDLKANSADPNEYVVRSARPNEQITGALLGQDKFTSSVIGQREIIVVDTRDVPPQATGDVSFTASRNVSQSYEQARERQPDLPSTSRQQSGDRATESRAGQAQVRSAKNEPENGL
jgi:cell filamentation protein